MSILFLIVVDNLVILGLGALDYLLTGQFEAYQITIVIVLLYGVAFGKRDFKRLDAYLERKTTKRKQRPGSRRLQNGNSLSSSPRTVS